MLQSEMEKLSDEIEKGEERILELNQQVETSHHDQVTKKSIKHYISFK